MRSEIDDDELGEPPETEILLSEGSADPATKAAKKDLVAFFEANRNDVFYQRQLEVIFERPYYHWVTVRALNELVAEGRLISERFGGVTGLSKMRFYWHRSLRYWKRELSRLAKFVETEMNPPEFLHAIGRHAEMMFDAGFGTIGFANYARNTNRWGGKEWNAGADNLDRIYGRDGIFYGAEIKNTLAYIPEEELDTKLAICSYLGLRPLFIMRGSPKTYNFRVVEAGGYALVFEHQLYPFGGEAKAARVRSRLRIKVDCPATLYESTMKRFERWHLLSIA